MSGEKSGKMSLGVSVVSLFFLFLGISEAWAGLLTLRFDLSHGFLLLAKGALSTFIGLGILGLKWWSWYLAVGVSIVGFFRYFVVPHNFLHIPLELIVFPCAIAYLFIRRDLFFGEATFGIKNWMKINKLFVLAVVVWVTIFFAFRPFVMESYTIALNDGVSHNIGTNKQISMVATALKQPDLDTKQDYYLVNIRVHSEKPMNVIHLTIYSERGICDMWQPSSGWKSSLRNIQWALVDVTGGFTNQIRWTISSSDIFDLDFEANYVISEEDSFDWHVEVNIQKPMSIWLVGLDAGTLGIIIAWSAIRYKKR